MLDLQELNQEHATAHKQHLAAYRQEKEGRYAEQRQQEANADTDAEEEDDVELRKDAALENLQLAGLGIEDDEEGLANQLDAHVHYSQDFDQQVRCRRLRWRTPCLLQHAMTSCRACLASRAWILSLGHAGLRLSQRSFCGDTLSFLGSWLIGLCACAVAVPRPW